MVWKNKSPGGPFSLNHIVWLKPPEVLVPGSNIGLTCVCVWWRWRVCHPSSWWWSCRSAGPGIPPPSAGTRAAASLWPSCRPTDRSPECPRSGGRTRCDTVRDIRCRRSREEHNIQDVCLVVKSPLILFLKFKVSLQLTPGWIRKNFMQVILDGSIFEMSLRCWSRGDSWIGQTFSSSQYIRLSW